jgi:hypothetical protein
VVRIIFRSVKNVRDFAYNRIGVPRYTIVLILREAVLSRAGSNQRLIKGGGVASWDVKNNLCSKGSLRLGVMTEEETLLNRAPPMFLLICHTMT